MSRNEKTAPYEPTAIGSEQSSTYNSIITRPGEKVKWLSEEKKIDEPMFCECFCEHRELRYFGGTFCSIDGEVNSERIRAEISRTLTENGIKSGVANKTNLLFEALKLFCHAEPITPRTDEIHVLNGVIKVDGRMGEPPTFIPQKRFCVNRLNINYDPEIWKHQYYPEKFMDFLCGLLDFEDIQTLQEYLGYCLINANNLSIKIRFTQSKKSNRIFGRKHLTLMREFGTRSRPSLNDRYRLFQA